MDSGPSTRNALVNVREDDFVEYFLFSLGPAVNLSVLKGQIDQIVAEESQDYIWQKDHFEVIIQKSLDMPPVVDNEEHLPGHLYGVTHYGENIEDEWFIVYLLAKLTKSIPGLIARVVDSDGEFLLIEAADHLPRWASPDTCEKRRKLQRMLACTLIIQGKFTELTIDRTDSSPKSRTPKHRF